MCIATSVRWRSPRTARCGQPGARGRCADGWRAARSWWRRVRAKNEIHAILMRRLKGRPDVSDLFGKQGRAWLAELELPVEERETLDSGLRQVDFLDQEIA